MADLRSGREYGLTKRSFAERKATMYFPEQTERSSVIAAVPSGRLDLFFGDWPNGKLRF